MSLKNQNVETKEKKTPVAENKAADVKAEKAVEKPAEKDQAAETKSDEKEVKEKPSAFSKVVKAFSAMSAEERIKAYSLLKPAVDADLNAVSVGKTDIGTEEYDKL